MLTLTTILVTVLLAGITTFLVFYRWRLQYWQRKRLNNLSGTIPFGTIENPLKRREAFGVSMRRIYRKMRDRGWRHGGIYLFASPTYFILDLDYVKNILTKDFQYFVDCAFYYNERDDPITAHFFAIGGVKCKNLRAKHTPTFSLGRIKMMIPIIEECVEPLLQAVEEHNIKNSSLDIKEVLACFTTNIIGSFVFGLECNTFKQANSPFRVDGKKVFEMTKFQQLKFSFARNFARAARLIKIGVLKGDTSDFFFEIVRETVEYRERNNLRRNDFMQLLIDMKNEKEYALHFDEIVDKAFIFFMAGFETSSTMMTFALYEMAANQDIQAKAREEVNREMTKQHFTYESLHDLKYMQQVIDETLRKYPPIPFITRVCVKDYKVPDVDLVIEKETRVGIPVLGIHYDPEYYPEPEKFDPERFSDENKQRRNQYAHIPFGEGPGLCIGLRFGIMQTKVGLASLLRSYKFTVSQKTEQPIEFDANSFILSAKGNVCLNVDKIKSK